MGLSICVCLWVYLRMRNGFLWVRGCVWVNMCERKKETEKKRLYMKTSLCANMLLYACMHSCKLMTFGLYIFVSVCMCMCVSFKDFRWKVNVTSDQGCKWQGVDMASFLSLADKVECGVMKCILRGLMVSLWPQRVTAQCVAEPEGGMLACTQMCAHTHTHIFVYLIWRGLSIRHTDPLTSTPNLTVCMSSLYPHPNLNFNLTSEVLTL